MTTIKKYVMWSVLFSALIGLSGCGSSSSDVTTASASNFSMTLDVEESAVEGDWKTLSSAGGDDPLSASVVTQGNYGNFVVEDDALTYLKTVETNETDTGILEISNNGGTVQVTVTVHSLYWKQISEADGHTSAIKSDGTLWSWGVNNDGQLGNGTTDDSTTPVQEDTGSAEWVSTSSGGNHTAALKSDGTIWSWGLNGYGQLGDGATDSSAIPVQEESEAIDWISVRAGSGYSVGKKQDGEKRRWGRRNTVPVANDQSVVTDENVAAAITLTGSDADNDPLTYTVVSDPSNGTLTGTAPNLTYTPNIDYDGLDSFTFKVNDGSVDSKVATVSITVNPVVVNTPPVANDQAVVTDENVAAAITLTGSDADNDALTYTVVSDPTNGTLTGTAPNLTYTPNIDYSGPDSFTFTVNDGTVDSAPATVSITVNAGIIVNTPPVANDQAVVTDENVAKAITLTGSDADDDPLTYAVVDTPSNGTLSGTAPNLTYTPNTDYDGLDSFTFKVNDGLVDSAVATVSITVNPVVVNTPPVANDQAVVTDENVAKAITLTGSDADDDPLTYAVVDTPSNGTLSGTAPNLTYTPDADYDGLDSFTFKVNDGTEDSAVATVSITVNSVYASADALAQIGLEADDPDVVDSNITVAQLNVILPVLTDINAAYETAYQDYIDANPDLFSNPATQAEVQAMIDAVNATQSATAASDAVLAQIGLEADNPDTINSVVTVAQLNVILPALTNVNAAYETAYQAYIDANPDAFASPATQGEVQAMIDAVNVAQSATVDPAESNVTVSSTSIVADGVATSTIIVTVKNTTANFVTDATVTLAQTGSSTISSVTNNNDGTYTFTVSSTTEETVTYTATANSVEITATADVTFTALIYGGNLDTTFGSKDTLDTTFGTDGIVGVSPVYPATDIILDSSDNIYIAAGAGHKYDSNGTFESSFGFGVFSTYYGITLDSSENIYIVGITNLGEVSNPLMLYKHLSTGVADPSFGFGDGYGWFWWDYYTWDVGYDLTVDNLGNIYVTGAYGLYPGDVSQGLVTLKFTSAGVLDTTFGSGGFVDYWGSASFNRGYGVILDNLNNIYVTGISKDDLGDHNMVILKYTSAGVPDVTFGTGGVVTYNSTSYDYGREIVRDSSGNLYVVGGIHDAISSDDIVVWKYTSAGVLDTTFGTGGMAVYDNAGASDQGFALVLDSLGSIYVTGYSHNGTDNDMFVLKYTSAGVLDSTFDSDGILMYDSGGDDRGEGIAIDSKGNLIVTGTEIWKYTGTGIVVHDNAAGGDGDDQGAAMTLDDSGNVYVAGSSVNSTGDSDMAIWKYTGAGDLNSTFGADGIVVHDSAAGGDGYDQGAAMTLDGSGNIYVTGSSVNSAGDTDMAIWKYTSAGVLDTNFDSDGIAVHNSAAGGDGNDQGAAMTLDDSGNLYVAGYSSNGANHDMAIWKYTSAGVLDTNFDSDGIVVHDSAAGGTNYDLGYAITLDGSGNIYVTGSSVNSAGDTDMAIWKYTSAGVLDTNFDSDGIAVHNSAAGGNSQDGGVAIVLDGSGNVYVAGGSFNSTGDSDMTIWKYTAAGVLDNSFGTDGIAVHNSAAGGDGDDVGYAITLDGSGNVYVAGFSSNGANLDMAIWKYTSAGDLDSTFGADGIALHNSAAGGDGYDQGAAMTLDSSGSVYVTGSSTNSDGNTDMVIWKYK